MDDDAAREHEDLLDDWSQRRSKRFIRDGAIDQEKYAAASPKVLFLLEEAYGEPREEDMRAEFRYREGPYANIWWNASRWILAASFACEGGQLPAFGAEENSKRRRIDAFLSSAIVNVKKADGRSTSDAADILDHAKQDRDLLERQVDLLAPDIVISGGVWECARHLWPDATQIYDRVWSVDGMLLLNFWHPAARFSHQLCYYTIATLIREAGHVIHQEGQVRPSTASLD